MKNQIILTMMFLACAGMAVAQEVAEPVLNVGPYFVNLITALIPILAYLVLFFVKKYKAKIPKALRPALPALLSLAAGLLGGLVTDGTSAIVAAALGAATTIIYDVVASLQTPVPPAPSA